MGLIAINRVLPVLAALAISASLMPNASAQFDEGQLIQTPDGSQYVMEGGQLHPITVVPVEFQDLIGVPLGADADNGVMLRGPNVAQAPPPPAAQESAPAPQQPTTRVTAVRVQRPYPSSTNTTGITPAGQEWAVIRVRYENLSEETRSLGNPNRFHVELPGSVMREAHLYTVNIPDRLQARNVLPHLANEGNILFAVTPNQPIRLFYRPSENATPVEIALP